MAYRQRDSPLEFEESLKHSADVLEAFGGQAWSLRKRSLTAAFAGFLNIPFTKILLQCYQAVTSLLIKPVPFYE